MQKHLRQIFLKISKLWLRVNSTRASSHLKQNTEIKSLNDEIKNSEHFEAFENNLKSSELVYSAATIYTYFIKEKNVAISRHDRLIHDLFVGDASDFKKAGLDFDPDNRSFLNDLHLSFNVFEFIRHERLNIVYLMAYMMHLTNINHQKSFELASDILQHPASNGATYHFTDFCQAVVSSYKNKFRLDEINKSALSYRDFLGLIAFGSTEYVDYFQGFKCKKTYSEIEVNSDYVFTCCPSYLPTPVAEVSSAVDKKGLLDADKNVHLKAIVNSTTTDNGKFQFCSITNCPKIKQIYLRRTAADFSDEIHTDDTQIDMLKLSFDATCNLWCSYCRKEKIVAKTDEQERHVKIYRNMIEELLGRTKLLFLNGYGDVFASRICRKILSEIDESKYPDLRIHIITNGILFTEKAWQQFSNCHYAFEDIRISVDAASKQTYETNRLGGDWDKLMQSLNFVSRLKKEGLVSRTFISMVVQDNNFREMIQFYDMGVELGCTKVIYEELMDWNSIDKKLLDGMIVSRPSHHNFQEFKSESIKLNKYIKDAYNEDNSKPWMAMSWTFEEFALDK